jgi:cytochrome P450
MQSHHHIKETPIPDTLRRDGDQGGAAYEHAEQPSLQREALEPVQIGGYELDPGTMVWVDLHLVHHDPRWFEDPDRFWPERFDKDRIQRNPRQAFLAFGAGPRTCIGLGFSMMELQLVLAVVGQSYRLAWPAASADRSQRLSLNRA